MLKRFQYTHDTLICTLLLLITVVLRPGFCQIVDAFQAGTHSFRGTELPYRLFVPEGYDSLQRYPLILFLHGAGERGTDNFKPVNDNLGAQLFAEDANQSKHPSFILAPQCPASPQQWVDVPWSNGSYEQDLHPISNELRTVVDLLDTIEARYSVDSNRLYAVGSSMGGFGTWDIITRYPHTFAAAIPVVGAGDPSKTEKIQHMGLWVHHGDSDRVVPVTGSRNMMLALDSLGSAPYFTHCNWTDCDGPVKKIVEDTLKSADPPRHIYSEYDGRGHELWYSAYEQFEGIADWLFSFSKKETPTGIQHYKHQRSIAAAHSNNTLRLSSQKNITVSLYTIAGKNILLPTDKGTAITLSLKNRRSGLYLLRATSEKKITTFQIIIP